MKIIKVSTPKEIPETAKFFHKKWGVPLDAYIESMQESLSSKTGVPAWYYIKNNNEIIAGLGIIENDFHKRKDLRPNICAVYVKEDFQKQGIAKKLLNHACNELSQHHIEDVYLITTHQEFYEHCNFSFVGMIEEDDGNLVRCYHRKTKAKSIEKE